MEEQPYVTAILEWDDYKYKQQLMILSAVQKSMMELMLDFLKE